LDTLPIAPESKKANANRDSLDRFNNMLSLFQAGKLDQWLKIKDGSHLPKREKNRPPALDLRSATQLNGVDLPKVATLYTPVIADRSFLSPFTPLLYPKGSYFSPITPTPPLSSKASERIPTPSPNLRVPSGLQGISKEDLAMLRQINW
jgi:hypothetical protein